MTTKNLLCGCSFDGYEFKPCFDHAVDRALDESFNSLADDLTEIDRKHGVSYDYSALRERKAPAVEDEEVRAA